MFRLIQLLFPRFLIKHLLYKTLLQKVCQQMLNLSLQVCLIYHVFNNSLQFLLNCEGLVFITPFCSNGAAKPSKPAGKVKSIADNSAPSAYKNPEKFVEEIMDKTSALLLSEVINSSQNLNRFRNSLRSNLNRFYIQTKGESVEALTETLRKRLTSDFTHLAVSTLRYTWLKSV